ncbi:MAG: hypothetical protein ACO1QB_15220 [Verrucomicrobiales bacterium]
MTAGLIQAGEVELISRPLRSSVTAYGISGASVVSGDGRYVLFMSSANNLTTNLHQRNILDLLMRDLQANKTTLISVDIDGSRGGNGDSYTGQTSTNGQYVVFESKASNLATNDNNDEYDIFLRDLSAGTTELISRTADGDSAPFGANEPMMSDDGKIIVFQSEDHAFANDIPASEGSNIFVRDMSSGLLERASVDLNLPLGVTNIFSRSASLSASGRYVAFETSYRKGAEQHSDIFVRDLEEGTTHIISEDRSAIYKNRTGRTEIAQAFHPLVSHDGEHLFWKIKGAVNQTTALLMRSDILGGNASLIGTNDTTGDTLDLSINLSGTLAVFPKGKDILLWDASTGLTNLINKTVDGSAISAGIAGAPTISGDGKWITFLSNGTDLVTNVVNGDFQWYLQDRETGLTTLLSRDANDEGITGNDIASLSMSDDGLVVVFDTAHSELIPNDFNMSIDTFVAPTTSREVALVTAVDTAVPNATGFGSSKAIGLSADGRYLLFTSSVDYLDANDYNGLSDVFLHDNLSGSTALVSVSLDGIQPGDRNSHDPVMSDDGRYVAFASLASDLVTGDTNNLEDIFLRDMQTGETTLISANRDGTSGGDQASSSPQISADGSVIIWESKARNLSPEANTAMSTDIFMRDIRAGVTSLVSQRFSPPATAPNGDSFEAALSPDGKWVAFKSRATDLIEGGNLNRGFTFVKNLATGQTRALFTQDADPTNPLLFTSDSRKLIAAQFANVGRKYRYAIYDLETLVADPICEDCSLPAVDASGKWVAFLQKFPEAEDQQLILMNLETRTTNVVSFNKTTGVYADDSTVAVSISADGNLVVFYSKASNLVPEDQDDLGDIYLYDHTAGALSLLTLGSDSDSPEIFTGSALLSSDGSTVAFHDIASNLVAGDYNEMQDVFRIALSQPQQSIQISAGFVAASGEFQLEWTTTAGHRYQVEYKTDFGANSWTPLGTEIIGDGKVKRVTDVVGGNPHRFYRIKSANP